MKAVNSFPAGVLLLMSTFVSAIDLSDDVLIEGEVFGSQKMVVILDDSSSMNANIIHPVSNGGNPINLWNYFRTPLTEIFRNAKHVDFAITTLDTVANNYVQVYNPGSKLMGETDAGNPHPDLIDAIDQIYAPGTHGSTRSREATLQGARFLMCQPGTQNIFMKGTQQQVKGLGFPPSWRYNCWNTIDYNANTDAQQCSKHSLWLFTDGTWYGGAGFDANANFQDPFFNGYRGDVIGDNYDGVSTFTPGDPITYSNEKVGFADVAKRMIELAEAGNFNFEFNFAMMLEVPVSLNDVDYSLDGATTNTFASLPLLEKICTVRNQKAGLGTVCSPDPASPQWSNQWDWMGSTFWKGPTRPTPYPYWPTTSPVNEVFDTRPLGTEDDRELVTSFDMLLGLWHLKQAGMLNHAFFADPELFEAEIPDLIRGVANKSVARTSLGGIAVNGTEYEDADNIYQPYFVNTVSDIYRYQVTDDELLAGNLAYVRNAADEVPDDGSRNVWGVRNSNRRPFKLPPLGSPAGWYNSLLNSWFSSGQLSIASIQERALWILNQRPTLSRTRERLDTHYLPDPATSAAVPSYIGDIVDSRPVHVGQAFFQNRSGKAAYTGEPSYETFKQSVATRPEMLYAGDNAAMLHGFSADTMRERFAYVPSQFLLADVDGNHILGTIQAEDYEHKFGVDSTPVVQDVIMTAPLCATGQSRCWRTVIGGGLRRGGKGYYLLDITDPTVFERPYSNSEDGEDAILWEYSHLDHLGEELGFTYSSPVIHASNWVNFGKYTWTMVFGNGLNSTSGAPYLYVLAIDRTNPNTAQNWTGSNVKRIAAPAPSTVDNGLLSPVAVDLNDDDLIDYYYAGDMHGNLYRFNVSSANPADWRAHLLFNSESNSTDLAVHSAPVVVKADQGRTGVNVVFATGHLYNKQALSDSVSKSVFGVWDEDLQNTAVEIRRGDLQQQSMTYYSRNGKTVRGFPKGMAGPDYSGGELGWVIDLKGPGSTNLGERAVSLVLHKNVVVTTSHSVREFPPFSQSKADNCIPTEYAGYVSLFDPHHGGAKFDLIRFATGDGIESSADDGDAALITSIRVDSAPSEITFSRTGKAFYQDASGTVEQIVVEGTNADQKANRLSWTSIRS